MVQGHDRIRKNKYVRIEKEKHTNRKIFHIFNKNDVLQWPIFFIFFLRFVSFHCDTFTALCNYKKWNKLFENLVFTVNVIKVLTMGSTSSITACTRSWRWRRRHIQTISILFIFNSGWRSRWSSGGRSCCKTGRSIVVWRLIVRNRYG